MSALKPCPWCGATKINTHEGSTFRWLAVECAECGARPGEIRVQTIGDGTPEKWAANAQRDAIEAWNGRAHDLLLPSDLDAIRRAAVVIRDAGYEDALAAQLEAIAGGGK